MYFLVASAKTNCKKIVGVETQKNVAEMATRSVLLNNLQNKIEIINSDILDLKINYHH